jgi:rubrerythrin
MENIDPAKAARVWQRVQGGQNRDPEELVTLAAYEQSDAAMYLQLSRRFQGKEAATLRQLYEQELSHAACLKGMYQMLTGNHLPVSAAQPAVGENTQAALRRCYGREMQSLAAYEARVNDPEYGQVFQRLAQQEREHCRILLTVIGNLKKGK